MNKIGIIKEIDNLGRLQIPKEIRKRLGFSEKVELVTVKEGLLIKSIEYELVKKCEGEEEKMLNEMLRKKSLPKYL